MAGVQPGHALHQDILLTEAFWEKKLALAAVELPLSKTVSQINNSIQGYVEYYCTHIAVLYQEYKLGIPIPFFYFNLNNIHEASYLSIIHNLLFQAVVLMPSRWLCCYTPCSVVLQCSTILCVLLYHLIGILSWNGAQTQCIWSQFQLIIPIYHPSIVLISYFHRLWINMARKWLGA